jgi:phosphoenolpyruvate carboxykinase (ATP)
MKIAYTRAIVRAALDGRLAEVGNEPDPIFGVHVPVSCPDVPTEVLKPRDTWKNERAYDEKARHLAKLFRDNFQQFAAGVSDEVKNSGPIAN